MAISSDGAQLPGASAAPLSTEVTERAGAVVVGLSGEVDSTTVQQAAAAVDRAVDQALARSAPVVLDLTGVTFFASVGLNLLVALNQRVQDRPLDVRLAVSAAAVLRPLQLMGLSELFPVYPTLADALAPGNGQA
jgi:anti-sigma B factor antagonist